MIWWPRHPIDLLLLFLHYNGLLLFAYTLDNTQSRECRKVLLSKFSSLDPFRPCWSCHWSLKTYQLLLYLWYLYSNLPNKHPPNLINISEFFYLHIFFTYTSNKKVLPTLYFYLKICQNKKGCLGCPQKMMCWSQLPAIKKTSILVAIPNKYLALLISLGL